MGGGSTSMEVTNIHPCTVQLMAMLMQGKYATGQIVGQYEVGGVVNIAVQVSREHHTTQ